MMTSQPASGSAGVHCLALGLEAYVSALGLVLGIELRSLACTASTLPTEPSQPHHSTSLTGPSIQKVWSEANEMTQEGKTPAGKAPARYTMEREN